MAAATAIRLPVTISRFARSAKKEPSISRSGHSSCENGTQPGTIKPCRRVNRDQQKDQSSLSEQACTSEKKRAGRRIHEIVLPRAKEINFMACKDMLPGFVPKFVIKESAAPEVAQKRKSRKHNRRDDKHDEQCAK